MKSIDQGEIKMGDNMVQARWSLLGMTALVTGRTQGIGSLSQVNCFMVVHF